MSEANPKYSICMCNYNMADTLERALSSVLEQLDDMYEVVVVDDGSSDDSVAVIRKMQQNYNNLRLVELKRDKRRRLGFTRNISIREASGEYVLLHLDCDDVYDSYLKDFVAAFHQIEDAAGHDVLVAGKHINMGRKDFLLEHGPYENIMRGEDRILWRKMASMDSYIPFEHFDFCTRLPKSMKKKYLRTICYMWDHLQNDFLTSGNGLVSWLICDLTSKRKNKLGLKLRILRLAMVSFAYIAARFKDSVEPPEENMNTIEKFIDYRKKMGGNLEKILNRYDKEVDWSKIRPEARHVFE